jgi:hypothetical protein
VMLFGEASLRHVLNEYVDHYHQERNHQGTRLVMVSFTYMRSEADCVLRTCNFPD